MIETRLSDADARCEVKAVCEERALPAMLGALRLVTAGIRPLYEDRVVQSVYFDTHDGAAVAENLSGVAVREKLRFRFYGELPNGGVVEGGQLEVKRRVNSLGTKEVYRVDEPVLLMGAPRRDFVDQIAEVLEFEGTAVAQTRALELRRREPAQWIRYRRKYLTTADRKVRVTLDTDLRAFDQRFGARLQNNQPTVLPRLLVIELKAAAADRDRIEELIQELPLVVDKNSKFTLASAPRHAATASVLGW